MYWKSILKFYQINKWLLFCTPILGKKIDDYKIVFIKCSNLLFVDRAVL
jgi:hypothetical protein